MELFSQLAEVPLELSSELISFFDFLGVAEYGKPSSSVGNDTNTRRTSGKIRAASSVLVSFHSSRACSSVRPEGPAKGFFPKCSVVCAVKLTSDCSKIVNEHSSNKLKIFSLMASLVDFKPDDRFVFHGMRSLYGSYGMYGKSLRRK